jgi:protein-disulfide isomerase
VEQSQAEPEATTAEVEYSQVEPEAASAEVDAGLTAEGYPYLGSPDAPVKMYEFSDYFCGHCAHFALDTAPLIEQEYVNTGQVQYIVQYYALGMDARLSVVEAGACAADQGRFFEYQRELFSQQQQLGQTPVDQWGDLLLGYAQQLGLDVDVFGSCWEQAPHQEQILASIDAARQKGVGGTPAFLINGELVVGNQPYEQFQAIIEQALDDAN